jgi:hypothetical protein
MVTPIESSDRKLRALAEAAQDFLELLDVAVPRQYTIAELWRDQRLKDKHRELNALVGYALAELPVEPEGPTESAAILLLRRIKRAAHKDLGDWWRTANISGDLMDEVERFLGQVDEPRCLVCDGGAGNRPITLGTCPGWGLIYFIRKDAEPQGGTEGP